MGKRLDVAIIGAGMGGLTAAATLALAGIEATVYEQAPEFTRIGSGHRPDERRMLTERASRVRITSPRPLPVRADAVDLGVTPVVFEMRPSVLAVVAPAPSASPGPLGGSS